MLKPPRVRAFPAVLSLSAFFLTSCLIIARPDRTVDRPSGAGARLDAARLPEGRGLHRIFPLLLRRRGPQTGSPGHRGRERRMDQSPRHRLPGHDRVDGDRHVRRRDADRRLGRRHHRLRPRARAQGHAQAPHRPPRGEPLAGRDRSRRSTRPNGRPGSTPTGRSSSIMPSWPATPAPSSSRSAASSMRRSTARRNGGPSSPRSARSIRGRSSTPTTRRRATPAP